ncbi:MAG: hypothetical protein QOF01_3307 [Thermomicrobiales bacterium]|nr:hypothetical protein [Thermomicrobiales bacterium]
MRRIAFIAFVALLTFGIGATPVSAGKGWCRSDPIVSLNGVELQFWIAIPEEEQADVIGPISVTLVAPRSSDLTLIYTDPGFSGYGESIQLAGNGDQIAEDGTFTVTATVSVPMRGNQFIPMQVEIVPDSGESVYVEGEAVGLTVTLTLAGSTISHTKADRGEVITETAAPDEESPVETTAEDSSAGGEEIAGDETSVAPSPNEDAASGDSTRRDEGTDSAGEADQTADSDASLGAAFASVDDQGDESDVRASDTETSKGRKQRKGQDR